MQRILDYFNHFGNRARFALDSLLTLLQNKDIFVVLVILLVAFASFGLGRLSKITELKEPITIEETGQEAAAVTVQKQNHQVNAEQGKYVASKNGTKYYLPWCGGVDRILEANKVWFATKEEAETRGLTPAANCSGI